MRNCKVDNNRPLLNLKMRPDTYQIYENITIEHITGKCGTLINMAPWTQYFDMKGSKEKPYGTIRNITLSDIDVSCDKFANLQGNPTDTVSNIVFRNVTATAKTATFTNIYKDVKFENVTLNGKKL
jgi:hypothetical protein